MGHSLSDAHAPPLTSGPTSEELLQDRKKEAKSIRIMLEKLLFIDQPAGCRLSRTVRKPGSRQNATKQQSSCLGLYSHGYSHLGSSGRMSPGSPIFLIGLNYFFNCLCALKKFRKHASRPFFSVAHKVEVKPRNLARCDIYGYHS